MENKKFEQMSLISPILKALESTGYTTPTPIQQQSIPLILAHNDLLGIAQTGTGKTAAFSLPIIQKLHQSTLGKPRPYTPRALILAPTRELALQIQKNIETYSQFTKLASTVIFGGVGQGNQVKALEGGVDILVATTGRLLDLMEQRYVNLDKVEYFVLDEADRMLDMGFFPDITRIITYLPRKRQNLFFSATMVKEIQTMAARILHEPKKVEVTPDLKTAEKVKQSVVYVEKERKLELLIDLLNDNALNKVIVFIEMKHVANRVTEKLVSNRISAAAIHSDKSQGARQRALEEFKSDKVRVLVATDIAARGIDVDGISHVINYDLSHIVESYVHRIGRTARAGASGEAITFCTGEEKSFLFAIEKEIGIKIDVITDNQFYSHEAANAPVHSVGKAKAMLEAKRQLNKAKSGAKRPSSGGGRGGEGTKSSRFAKGKGRFAKGKSNKSEGGGSSSGAHSGSSSSSGTTSSSGSGSSKSSGSGHSSSRSGAKSNSGSRTHKKW